MKDKPPSKLFQFISSMHWSFPICREGFHCISFNALSLRWQLPLLALVIRNTNSQSFYSTCSIIWTEDTRMTLMSICKPGGKKQPITLIYRHSDSSSHSAFIHNFQEWLCGSSLQSHYIPKGGTHALLLIAACTAVVKAEVSLICLLLCSLSNQDFSWCLTLLKKEDNGPGMKIFRNKWCLIN